GDAGLGFLRSEKPRARLDDGHLRAESRERLPQLDADGAAPQHRERDGKLAWQGGLAVGPVVDLVQARDRRNCGRASVGDPSRLASDQLLAADLDRAQVDQLAVATYELCAGRFQRV